MSSETLQWEIEGFNHRAQGRRRVYLVRVVDPLGDNRFRPAIQRGAVTFYCDCPFHKLEDAKRFCQADHDSIQEVCDEDNQTLRTRLQQVESERDKAEADAAVMREALERVWEEDECGWIIDPSTESKEQECVKCGAVIPHQAHTPECTQGFIHVALSTNAGKSLLERLKEAEWLLLHSNDLPHPDDWFDRRDAFLKPTTRM